MCVIVGIAVLCWLFILRSSLTISFTMQYVYIIKSIGKRKIYIGCTSDLRERLKEHNSGKVESTKFNIPWEIRYYEAYFSKKDAFEREKQLKRHAKGTIELKKRLKDSLK
jgi:putative endonuclease